MLFPNVRALREDRDLTQRQLAAYLGVAQNTYSQYENGVIELTAPVLLQLGEYYGVSCDYLLGRTKEPCPAPAAARSNAHNAKKEEKGEK